MQITYVDESFDKRIYVLCGVFLADLKYRLFNERFNEFLAELCDLGEDEELKGEWLFNGRKHFEKYPLEKRAEIAKEIGNFIGDSNITKLIVGFSKPYAADDQAYLSILDNIISRSAVLTSRVGKTNRQLLVVFDERDKKMEDKIYRSIANKRTEVIRRYKKSCCFLDYGYSGNSSHSRMIQVADIVAYFIRNHLSTVQIRSVDPRKRALLADFKKSIEKKLNIKQIMSH